ncbi:hypothetical protein CAPTEDRAFT_221883 [Capitella teleta]|uniref:Uncharacterized protein n=1 Tax=Capitella teleta TaxID=283909 RepID=R7T744_CAPTE|nr:hypothetical protein CAPTEDRAFT_221883 [Capitella teleta]|eukprot:ELT87185.1 hypothetical protein CAPTEDRAFT_221883 [Capitella teleta]
MDNDQTYKDIGSVTQWTDSLGSNLDPRGETKKKGTKKDKHEGKKHKKKKKGVCDTGEDGCGGLPMEGFINKLDQSPPDSREDLVNPVGEPELEKIQQRTQETEDALILQKQQEEETTRPLAFQEETDKGFNTPPENTVTVLAEVYDAQDDTRESKKKKKKKGKKKLSKSMSELDVDESEVTSKKSKKLKKITSKSISNLKNPNAIETPLPSCSVDVEYVHSIGLSVANSTDITDNNASGSVQNDAPIDASYSSGSKDLAVKKDDRLASVTNEVDESEDVITSEVIARGGEDEQEREEMECMDGTDEKQKHDNLETEHDLIGCTGHDSQTVTMVDPYIHAKKKHSFLTEESGLYNDLIDGNSRDDLSIHAPIDSFMPAEEKPSMADDPLVLLEEEKHPTKRKKKGNKSLEDLLIKDKSKKKKKIKDTLSKSMDESKKESVADQLKESMDTVELTSTQIESVPIKDTTELRAEGATLEPPTTLRSITNDHSDYFELGLPSQEEEMLDSAVTTVSGTKEVTDETTLHSKTKKLKKRTSKSQENLSEEDGTKKRKAKKAAKLCKSMDFLELNEPNVSRDHTEQHKEKTKKKKSKKNKDISKSVEDVVIDDSTPDCGVLQDSEIIKQHTIGVDESSNAFNDVDVGCSIGNSMDQMPETPEDCPPANLEGIQDSGISSGTKDDSDVINMDNNEDSPPCTARNPDTLSDVVRLDDSTIRKQSFTEDHNDYCALDLPSQVKKLKKRTSKSQEDLSDEENKKKRKSEKAKILSKSMDLLDFNDPNLPKMQSEHKQKTKKKKNKDTSMFLDNMVIEATISDVPGHCIPVEPRLGVNILPDESINVVPFADSPQNTPPDYHDNSHNPGDLDENHPQHDLPLKKKKKSSSANDCKKKKILSDSMNILDSGDATNKSTKKKKYNKLTNSASDIVPETIPTEIEFRETASENVVEPDVLDGKKDIPVVEMGSSTIIDEPSDLTDITHIENFDNDTSDKTDAQKDGQDIKEDNMESLPADHHNKDNDITGTDKLEADKLEKKKKKKTKKSKTCGVLAGVSCEHEENQIGNKEDYGLLEEIAKGGQSLGADLSLPFITNTFNNVDDEPLASKNVSVTGESKEDESNLLDPRQKRSFMEDFVEYNHDNQIALQDDNGDVQHVTRDLLDSIHHDMESMTSTNKPALPAQDNKQGVNDQQPIQPQSDIYQPEVTKKSKKKSKHQDGNSEKIKNKKKKTKKDEKLSRSMGDITNDFVPEIPEAIVADQVAQQLASEDMEVCESIVQTSMGTEHKSEGGKKSKSKKKKKMKLKAKSMGDLVLNTEMDADAAKKKKKKPKKEKDLTSEQIRDACVVTDGSAVIAKAEATNTTNVKELDTIAIPAQSSLMTEEFYNVALPNEKSNLQQNDTDYSIQAYMDDETFEADQTARAMLAYNRVVSNLRDKFLEESTIESDSQSFSVSDSLTVNPLRFYVPDKHSTPKNMLPSDMSIVSLDREPGQMGNKGQPEVEVDQAENKFDSFQANAESMELHDESLQDNPLKYYAPDKHSTPKFMDPNDLAKFQKDHPYQTNLVEIGEEVEPEKEFQSMELHEESLIDNPLKINSPDKHSTPRRMDPKVLADIGKEMGVLNEDLDPVDKGNKERLEAGTTTDENTMISSQEDSLRENPLQFYAPNKHSTPKVMTFEDFHLMSMEKEPGSQHSYGIDALIEDVHNTEVIEEAPVQTEDSNAIQKPAILKSNKSEKGSEKVDDEKPFEKTSDLPETSVLKEPMLFDQYHSSIESCRHIVTTPRELKRMKKAKSSKKLKGGNLSANVELSKSEGNISEEATEPKEMKSVSGAKSESNLDYSDNTEASKKKKKRKKSKLSAKSEPLLTTMNEESNISLKKTTKNKSDSLAAKSEPVLNVEEETLCEDSEKKKKKKKKQSLSAKSEFSVGLDCDVEESQNSSREKTRKTKREVKSMSAKSEPSLIIDDHSEEQPELKKENEKKKKIEKMSAKSEPTLTIENPSEEQPGVKKKKKKKKIEKMSAKSEPSLQACKETLQADKAHQLERSVTLPKVKKKKRSMDLDSPIPTGQQPELQFPDQHPLSNQSAAPDDLDIIIPSHEATRPVSLDDQVLNTDNLDAPIPVGGQPLKSTESMKRQNATRKTNNDDDIYDEISEYSKTTHKTIVGVADISGESGDLDAFIPHGTSGESDAFSDYQPLEVLDVSAPSPDLPPLPPLPPSIGNRPPISEYENVEFKQSDSPQDWVPSSGLGNIDVDIPLPKSPNPKDKTITKKLAMGISKLKDTISKIGKGKQKDEDDVDPYKAVDKEDKEPPCYDITEMAKNMPSFFPEFQDQFEYENSDEQDDDDDDTLYVIDVKRDAYPPGWHFRDRRCTLEPIMEEASSLGDVYESMDGAGCVTNRRMYSSDSKLEIREQGYVYDDDIYDVIDSGRDIQAEKMLGSGDFELLKSIVRESKNSASSTTSSDDEIYLEPTSLTGLSISAVYEGDDASSASILIDDTYEIPVDWRDQSRTSKDTITTPEEPLLAEDRNTRIKELVSSIVQASVDSALEVVTQSVKETGEENTEIPFIDDPEDEPSMEEDVVIATEKKVEELCYFEPVIIKEDITELSLADSSFGKASNPSVPMMQPAEKVVEIEAPSAQQAISLTPLEAPSAQQAVSLTSSFEIPKVDEGQLKTMEISLPEDQPENADLQSVSLKPSVEIPKVDDILPESMEISLPDDQAENEMPQYGVVVMGASTSGKTSLLSWLGVPSSGAGYSTFSACRKTHFQGRWVTLHFYEWADNLAKCDELLTDSSVFILVYDVSKYDDETLKKQAADHYYCITQRVHQPIICAVATHSDLLSDYEANLKCRLLNDTLHALEFEESRFLDHHFRKIQESMAKSYFHGTNEHSINVGKLVPTFEKLKDLTAARPKFWPEVTQINGKTGRGSEDLLHTLELISDIHASELPPQSIPKLWFLVQRRLATEEHLPIYEVMEFNAMLLNNYGILPIVARQIASYLETLGVVTQLDGIVVQTTWLVQHLKLISYKILFGKQSLASILENTLGTYQTRLLEKLLQIMGVCYKNDDGHLVAPILTTGFTLPMPKPSMKEYKMSVGIYARLAPKEIMSKLFTNLSSVMQVMEMNCVQLWGYSQNNLPMTVRTLLEENQLHIEVSTWAYPGHQAVTKPLEMLASTIEKVFSLSYPTLIVGQWYIMCAHCLAMPSESRRWSVDRFPAINIFQGVMSRVQCKNCRPGEFLELHEVFPTYLGAADDVASPDALNESQWHEETTEHINNTNQQLDDTIRHFKLIREKLEQAQEEIQCTEERIEQPYPSEEFMRNVQDYVHNIICAAYSQTLHEIRLEQIDEERAVDSDDSYLSAEDTPPCMLDGSEEEGLDKADTTLEYNINTESAHSKEEQMVRLDDVNTMDVVTTVQIESFLDDEVTICCESFTQTPVNHLRSMETQTEKRTLSSFISDSETLVPTSDDEDLYDDLPYDGPQRGTEGFIEDSLMPVTSTPALSAKSTMDVTEHLATKEFQELEIQTDLKMDEIVTATETGIQTHTSLNRTTQDNSCQTHSAVESQTDSLPVFTSSQAGSQWPLQDISDTQTEEISTRTQCLQVDKADIIASQSIASQADTNTSMDHQTQVSKYEIVNSRSASVETNFLEQCHSGTQVKPYEIPARDSFEVQTTSTAEAKSVQVGHHELYNHKNAGQQVEMYKMCSVGTQAQKTAVHSCGYTQTPEVISIPNQTQVNSWEMKSSTEKSIQATSTYFNAGVGTDAPITMARTVQVTREDLVKNFDKHVQSEETIFGKTTSSSTQTAKPKSFESSSQIHSWHFSTNVMLQTNTDELVSKSSAETQTNQNITSPQATRSTVVRPKDLVSTTVFGLPLSEWNTKAVVGTERTDSPSQTNSLATRVANTQVDSRDIVPQINVSTSAPPKSTYSGDSTTQVYSHDVVENTDEHSQIDQSEILRWFAQSKSVQSESCQISTSSQTQIDTVDFDNTSQTIDDDWEDAYQKRAGTSRSSSSTGVQTMDTFVDDFQHKNDIESVDVKQYFQSYLYYEKKPASPIAFSETLIVPNTTHAMRASPNLDWSQDQARAVTPLSEESLDVSRGSSWYSDNLNNPSLAVIALHHPEDQMKPRRKIPPATFPKPKKLTKKVPPKTLPKPKFPLSRIYQRDPNVKASSPPGPRPSFTPNLLKADQVPLTGPGQPSGQPTDQVTPYQSQQGGPQTTAFCLTGAPTTQAVPSASRRRRSRSEYPTTEMYAPEQEDCVFV